MTVKYWSWDFTKLQKQITKSTVYQKNRNGFSKNILWNETYEIQILDMVAAVVREKSSKSSGDYDQN
jgi:hypothetical protein